MNDRIVWRDDARLMVEAMAPDGAWTDDCYAARCPLHRDRDISFQFDLLTRAWQCHSGCGEGDLLSLAVRLWCCGVEAAATRLQALCGPARGVAQRYAYHDATGAFAFEVVRFSPKGFDTRIPSSWVWQDVSRGGPAMLYRLPELLLASEVFVLEGEKDCETARAMGLVATCNTGGSRRWREAYVPAFQDRHVRIIADADESGRFHARQIAGSLLAVAASVRMIEFVGVKDLTEWVEGGGTCDTLLALFDTTPPITAEDAHGWWAKDGTISLASAADFLQAPRGLRW
jgi:hypothetical protein